MKIKTLSIACARIIEGVLRKLVEFNVRIQPGPLNLKTNASGESYQEARNPVLKVLKSSFMHDSQYNFDWMLEAARRLEGERVSELFPEHRSNAVFILKVDSHQHEFLTVQLDNECIPFVQQFNKSDIIKRIGIVPSLLMRCKYTPGIVQHLAKINGKPLELSLDNLFNDLNVPASTRRWNAFNKTVLQPAQHDVKDTPLCFAFKPNKKKLKKIESVVLYLQTKKMVLLAPHIGTDGEKLMRKYGFDNKQTNEILTNWEPQAVIDKIQYINEQVRLGNVRQVRGAVSKPKGGVSVITDFESVSGGYSSKVFFGM